VGASRPRLRRAALGDLLRRFPRPGGAGAAEADERRTYRTFSTRRPFLLPIWLEKIVGKQVVFSLNNAWAKYYQDDKNKRIDYDEDLT